MRQVKCRRFLKDRKKINKAGVTECKKNKTFQKREGQPYEILPKGEECSPSLAPGESDDDSMQIVHKCEGYQGRGGRVLIWKVHLGVFQVGM